MMANFETEHCKRVADACGLAIKHAALLLRPSTQKFVDEILADGPTRRRQSLAKIKGRMEHTEHLEGDYMKPCDAEIGLLRALEFLVSRLWNDSVWWTRRYTSLLCDCWNGVAEPLDRQNWRRGMHWDGEDGPLVVGEKKYHREVVIPLVEESFRTMWDKQDELKKSAKNFGSETESCDAVEVNSDSINKEKYGRAKILWSDCFVG
jgi:hypothetical protein